MSNYDSFDSFESGSESDSENQTSEPAAQDSKVVLELGTVVKPSQLLYSWYSNHFTFQFTLHSGQRIF